VTASERLIAYQNLHNSETACQPKRLRQIRSRSWLGCHFRGESASV